MNNTNTTGSKSYDGKGFRIEWLWNGKWQHDSDGDLVYTTRAAAENWERFMRKAGSIPQFTRIVEVR